QGDWSSDVCSSDLTVPEAREYFTPPPRFAAKLELPAEVSRAEGLLFAARRLLVQLEGLLAARHAGVRAFTLTLLQSKASTVVEVRLASPAREAQRLGQLLREKLATLSLSCPVEERRVGKEGKSRASWAHSR